MAYLCLWRHIFRIILFSFFMSKKYLHIALLILPIYGCSSTTNEPCVPMKTTGLIIPLALGNQWIYRVTGFDDRGNVYPNPTLDTFTLSKDTIIKGEQWFFYDGGDIVINRSDGLYTNNGDSLPLLFYKYPANTGDTNFFPHGNSISVVSNDTIVSVPYGCFSTYQYTHEPFYAAPLDIFIAPGVGEVRTEYWTGISSKPYKYRQRELVSVVLH